MTQNATSYTRPRLLSGRDVAAGDQVAYLRGELGRGFYTASLRLDEVRWLPVINVMVDHTAWSGVDLPDTGQHLFDDDEPLVVRIPADQPA